MPILYHCCASSSEVLVLAPRPTCVVAEADFGRRVLQGAHTLPRFVTSARDAFERLQFCLLPSVCPLTVCVNGISR